MTGGIGVRCKLLLSISVFFSIYAERKEKKGPTALPLLNYYEQGCYRRSLKGIMTRDFRHQVFFHETVSSEPLSIQFVPFQIFRKIRENTRSKG
jgi:hypothetical protein